MQLSPQFRIKHEIHNTLFALVMIALTSKFQRFTFFANVLCQLPLSDPLTTVNPFDTRPKRYDMTGVDIRGNLSTKNKETVKLTKNGYKFCTSCLVKIDLFL